MQRKDRQKKRIALRRKPQFAMGYRECPCDDERLRQPFTHVYKVASLFSGCGGLDFGFLGGFSVLGRYYDRLPFDILGAYDLLQDAVDCYRLNIDDKIQMADLTQTPVSELPDADILIGGFPCQDFSSAGPKTGLDGKRGKLYQVLIKYMRYYRPRIVIGENVVHLARMQDGACLRQIVDDFEEPGYHFDVWNLYAPDYGVPQNRRRLIFVGVRNDIPGFPVMPAPTNVGNPITISKAIADLEGITDESVTNQSQYFVSTRATCGGGQGDNVNDPDKVAYCIRANSRGRIQFHYRLDRRLTVRECARLQTFPDKFVFPFGTQRNLTLIGNAVPPILAHAVAKSVLSFISAVDQRCENSNAITRQRTYSELKLQQGVLDL